MEVKFSTPKESKKMQAKSIKLDTGKGTLIIYPNHTDAIIKLAKNSKVYIDDKEYQINMGVVKIEKNEILIVADV
jgi:F0F1-type ATP synthase epsilon subunit